MTGPIGLGIDFGTSSTKAALIADGRVQLVLDDSRAHISSVVHVPAQGALRVVPAESPGLDPGLSITSIKRLLGRAHADPRVRELDAGVGYRIVRGADGWAHVEVDGKEIAPVQIVAAILRHVRELAERAAGRRLDQAILSMPVKTCPGYGPALLRAAQLAGLRDVELAYEPVAALWGSRIKAAAGRRVLVSDFGAGTYDCALLEVRADRVEVLASGGDELLGGDDLDLALADHIAGAVFRARRADLRRDLVMWSGVVRACERAKRKLSGSPTAELHLQRAFVKDGAAHDVAVRLQRPDAEALWRPHVDRAAGAARESLMLARTSAELVDEMVLVGGTSLVPMVRSTFVKRFGRQPSSVAASDVVIAAGLAMMAAQRAAGPPLAALLAL